MITAGVARGRSVRRVLAVLLTAAVAGGALVAGAPTAGAVQPTDSDRLPSEDPIDNTPRVQDGSVLAIARSGNRVFVGGDFTTVQPGGGGANVTRNRLFSYQHSTGQIDSWNPNIGGPVQDLELSPDGRWLYVSGAFSQAGGSQALRIERYDTTTGQRDGNFNPSASAVINDMELRGNVLYIAGQFTTVNNTARQKIAALNATTGALLPLNTPVTAPFSADSNPSVRKIDVDPAGRRLVMIGNFRTVAGADRPQIAVLDLDGNGNGSVASNWRTGRFGVTCNAVFDTYMRDVDISPDGTWMVISTTGSWGGASKLCDAASRFELNQTGTDIQPTWVNLTGGDTLIGVAVTSEAVYVGGHQRWANNGTPPKHDQSGPGAVSREGIMALDPLTGLPLTWNPGRQRGVGVFEILMTPGVLFIGHDTNYVRNELRPRLTGFPISTATNVDPQPVNLPTTLYQGRTDGSLRRANLGAGGVSGVTAASNAGINWSQLRGAFVQRGQLYAWNLNGALTRRSYDGTTAGAPTDLIADAKYVVGPPNNLTNVRAVAYDNGRIYYLRNGDNRLWWRWFSLESGIVGSNEFVANSGNWSSVTGIEAAGGRLYHTRTDGRLYSTTLSNGSAGAPGATLVDSATNWNNGNDLFFHPGAAPDPGPGPDVTPPSAPGKPTATSTVSGQANVSWAAATDDRATTLTYTVLRNGTPITTVNGPTTGTISFTDTGLTPGSVHTYSVRASDGTNTGPTSPASDPVTIAGSTGGGGGGGGSGPTVLASSDFSAGLGGWTNVVNLAVDNAVGAPTGAPPSARAQVTNAGATARLPLSSNASQLCAEVSVRASSIAGSGRYSVIKLRANNGSSVARIWLDGAGRLSVRNDTSGTRLDTNAVLTPGTWGRLGLCADVAGAAGRLRLTLNGTQVGSWTSPNGTNPISQLQLGDNDPGTVLVHFDDVRVTSGF